MIYETRSTNMSTLTIENGNFLQTFHLIPCILILSFHVPWTGALKKERETCKAH
jgi:hypothetical protein